MRTDNFYKVIIIVLLLINMGTLGYLWLGRGGHHDGPPGGPHPGRPDRMIIERLHLNEQQQEQFNELKHEHHSQMLEVQETTGRLHKELFTLLQNDSMNTGKKDSLLQLIQQGNLQKEMVTMEHFRKLRAILTEEQKPLFDDLVEDIAERIMGPHRKH
jgi:protein CpxP